MVVKSRMTVSQAVSSHVMATDAVFADGKGCVIVVARTARFPLVHVRHGEPVPGVTEPEYPGVAIGTAVNGEVKRMAECNRSGAIDLHQDISRKMAAGAVIQVKRPFAGMARAA